MVASGTLEVRTTWLFSSDTCSGSNFGCLPSGNHSAIISFSGKRPRSPVSSIQSFKRLLICTRDTLVQMRSLLNDWIEDTGDLGRFPEKEMMAEWLPDGKQPKLEPLQVSEENNHVVLTSNVPDATIIWKSPEASSWHIYTEPIPAQENFVAKAGRIGFTDSAI